MRRIYKRRAVKGGDCPVRKKLRRDLRKGSKSFGEGQSRNQCLLWVSIK